MMHFEEGDRQDSEVGSRQKRGRLYIPHGISKEAVYKPHSQHTDVSYSQCGPDWSSSIRWLPSPQPDGRKPKENTFYPPLIKLRHFPDKDNVVTTEEYPFYPPHGVPLVYGKGKITIFNNIHMSSTQSHAEITDLMKFGRKGSIPNSRDGFPEASPGDKPYQAAEYSPDFHKLGSTRPVVNFSKEQMEKPDTFIPLQSLPSYYVKPYVIVEAERKKDEEIEEVAHLEKWRPASPLQIPTTEWH